MKLSALIASFVGFGLLLGVGRAEALLVPASTAYSVPEAGGLRIEEDGVRGWQDAGQALVWYGNFAKTGKVTARVRLKLPEGRRLRLKLTLGERVEKKMVRGQAGEMVVEFGEFALAASGYQKVVLENAEAEEAVEILGLELEGEAVRGAHFNVDPRRNAASVHLSYATKDGEPITAFYNEVTAVEDPVHTYYMACGFSRGYFGMQVNSETERRIIFSVWDAGSGAEANDRSTVAEELHTKLLAKGEGVNAGVFGNEGTGGHSHLVYPWKTGEVQKFLVTAQPVGTATDYAGYWFQPEKKEWKLLAKFHAPQDGKYLRGLYSFSENFSGETGNIVRKARFGNQWIQTEGRRWSEIKEASFSHDGTGKAARLDRFMGVEDGQFFLSHGGFIKGFTEYGQKFTRRSAGRAPELKLPVVVEGK